MTSESNFGDEEPFAGFDLENLMGESENDAVCVGLNWALKLKFCRMKVAGNGVEDDGIQILVIFARKDMSLSKVSVMVLSRGVLLLADAVLNFSCDSAPAVETDSKPQVARTEVRAASVGDSGLIVWRQFAGSEGKTVVDSITGVEDDIFGNFKYVKGAGGDALRFDGYSTALRRKAKIAPKFGESFSIEAWVVLQAYPWGLCAIVSRCESQDAQYAKRSTAPQKDPAGGTVKFASDINLLIRRNHSKRRPANPVVSIVPSLYCFDGYIDEVKIHNRALKSAEIAGAYEAAKPSAGTGMAYRKLPTEPKGPALFGAYYTKLKFHETWDELRREGPHPDVIVLFDNMPWRFVFWRGSGFIPFWVTENNIWYTNEFNETWPPVDQPNVYEPMSDKQARFSHVRIIESNDARVVIHWRYALANTLYNIAWEDPLTGWGDWAYGPPEPPSSPQSEDPFGAQVAFVKELAYPNIQIVNTKSRAKPFLVVSDSAFEAPWPVHAKVDGPLHFSYTHGRINWEHCMFTWWNHWPVAQIPSDGRTAHDPDRVSHTAVSNWFWKEYESTQNTQVKISMQGLTEKSAEELVPLAKSWLRAPALKLKGSGYTHKGYDKVERVYQITCENRNKTKPLRFGLSASSEHPVINPALVIRGWGDSDATLSIDGKDIARGKEFRFGHRCSPEGKDLVVWIKTESSKPVEMSLFPE